MGLDTTSRPELRREAEVSLAARSEVAIRELSDPAARGERLSALRGANEPFFFWMRGRVSRRSMH